MRRTCWSRSIQPFELRRPRHPRPGRTCGHPCPCSSSPSTRRGRRHLSAIRHSTTNRSYAGERPLPPHANLGRRASLRRRAPARRPHQPPLRLRDTDGGAARPASRVLTTASGLPGQPRRTSSPQPADHMEKGGGRFPDGTPRGGLRGSILRPPDLWRVDLCFATAVLSELAGLQPNPRAAPCIPPQLLVGQHATPGSDSNAATFSLPGDRSAAVSPARSLGATREHRGAVRRPGAGAP